MPTGGGGGGGAGGGLVTDNNARLLVEDDVAGDTEAIGGVINDTPLFDFSEDVEPPSIEEGDSLGIGWGGPYKMLWGVGVYQRAGSFPNIDYAGPGAPQPPVLTPINPVGFRQVVSQLDGNIPWTATPNEWGCGLGPGSWGSWHESEYWVFVTIPEHPVDMAGIFLTFEVSNFRGAATGVLVRATDTTPVVGRQGEVVASGPLTAGVHTVLVPAALVPAEGGTLWVGLCPAWQADYDFSEGTPGDGSQGQCSVSFYPPFASGEGNSGALNVAPFSTAVWGALVSPGSGAFGTIVEQDDEDSPFEGGNDVIDFGGDASVYGVSDGSFYVTGPGTRCIGAVGDGETTEEDEGDDESTDQPMGIWADPWSIKGEFEVTDLGATDAYIEVTTNRGGSITVGKVLLGPTPGVSVTTSVGTDFKAVAITAGVKWSFRFDDRSEMFLRGKVWLSSLGEPAEWDVEIALPEEDDDEQEDFVDEYKDRFVVCLKAAEDQTVRLYPPTAQASAANALVHERLGWASGTTDRFVASMPFMPGTVEFEVGGIFVPPNREDAETGEVWLDYQPTAGMVVWLRYQAE